LKDNIKNDDVYHNLCKGLDVEIGRSSEHGRALFAKRDFEKGEPVLVDFPFTSCVNIDNV
jgi:cytochrome oxidase Cu insertion factor (SCO1/SenC/PrrC family)